jgi:hypothetical protein
MPRLPDFKARLAALPEDPTRECIEPLAADLAARCASESYPRKSVAAVLRHAKSVCAESTVAALREMVFAALSESSELAPIRNPPVIAPFIGIAEAARRLGITVKTLSERVREVRYRWLYGWPFWDDHQWNFSPDALDPALHAQHTATVPNQEPAAHVAMLPPWCLRQGRDGSEEDA